MGVFFRKTTNTSQEPVRHLTAPGVGPKFAVNIPAEFFGLSGYDQPVPYASRVDRRSALSVPAVKKARDLIAGSIGQLPLELHAPDRSVVSWPLFDQPEAGVARSITMTRIAEDLLLYGVAWLRVTHTNYRGYPFQVVRLDPTTVTVNEESKVYYSRSGSGMASVYLPDDQLIRIDSPNDPLLEAGARAIRTCLALDSTTNQAAKALPPLSYFSPKDGVDFETDSEDEDADQDTFIQELLDGWENNRGNRRTAWVPGSLVLNTVGWNPEELQLDLLKTQAVCDIARLCNLDPSDLGASQTSLTYFNAQDRDRVFLRSALGPYIGAIEGAFTMHSPIGYYAKANTSAFLRTDDKSRYEAYALGKPLGVYTDDEIRALEDKPALTSAEKAALPAPAPANEVSDNAV